MNEKYSEPENKIFREERKKKEERNEGRNNLLQMRLRWFIQSKWINKWMIGWCNEQMKEFINELMNEEIFLPEMKK